MEFRNAIKTADGRVDCEINHKDFGWIPFTADKNDPEPFGRSLFALAMPVATDNTEPAIDPLIEERQGMVCTVRQARIILGEEVCNQIDMMADNPEVPWALRQTLKYATTWERTLPEIDEIGWVLGYSSEQIDSLFREAMKV